jgi:hypothetical protein
MKPYCEIVSQNLLPTLRALIAKRLIEKYGLTQQDAAMKLGLTQSAISQYKREIRGSKVKMLEEDEIVGEKIEEFVDRVASGELDNALRLLDAFCELCILIRRRGLICNLHLKSFPQLKGCEVCLND